MQNLKSSQTYSRMIKLHPFFYNYRTQEEKMKRQILKNIHLLLLASLLVIFNNFIIGCGDNSDEKEENNLNNQSSSNNNTDNKVNANSGSNADSNSSTDNKTDNLVENAKITLRGAQNDSWLFQEEENYIDCMIYDNTISITAANTAGGRNKVDISVEGYNGFDKYEFTYSRNDDIYRGIKVVCDDKYHYKYFYDYSRSDYHEEYSNCKLSTSEINDKWISGTLNCSKLIVESISDDYDELENDFRPSVDLEMEFTCRIM